MAGRSTSQSCRSGGRPVENRGTAGKLPARVEVEQVSAGSFVEVVEECSETGSGSGSGRSAGAGSAPQCSCRSFASRARFSGEKAQCWVAASKAANCTRLVGFRLSIRTWEVKGTGEDITSSTGLMMLLASSGSLVRPTEGGSNTPARGFNGRTGGRGVKAAAEALSLWAVGENTSACARRGDGNRPTTSRVAAASSYSSSSALASAEAAAAASRAAASAGWFLSYHFLALSFSLVF